MSSPLVITIAIWELFNKILFLGKMSQCGNQFSQKCISFDYFFFYFFFETRGEKEEIEKELHSDSSGGGFP